MRLRGPGGGSAGESAVRHRALKRPAVAMLILLSACGRPAGPPAPDPACVVNVGGPVVAPLVIGVTDAVDPANAPAGTNDAERLLFRQLYEPLLRRDCAGALQPGLADVWEAEDAGRRWTFTLRSSARFWDGRPVRAADVVAAWDRRAAPWTGARALDSSRLAVVFPAPVERPLALADPRYAVTAPAGGWPLGTPPPGRVRHRVTDDARDLVDAGVHLFVTRDPAVAAYANAAGSHRVTPLPFDRVYVLTGRTDAARWDRSALPAAVHAAARPATGPYWFERAPCATPGGTPPAGQVVSYRGDDDTARELATRMVALLGSGWEAVADRRGAVRHVLALPLRPWQPCRPAGPPGDVAPLIETRAYLVHLPTVPVVIDYDGVPRIRGRRP